MLSGGPDAELFTTRTDDGAELASWRYGNTEAECVMLVHGFSLDHSTWQPVAELLADAGYQVVLPDIRGHGESTLGSAQPTVERLVQDVADIATSLDLPDFHLVGHSLGAVVALAARTSTAVDKRVRSVTSVAGSERSIQNPIMRLGARLFSSRLGIAMLKRQRTGRLMISTWFGKSPDPAQTDWIRLLSAECAPDTRQRITRATGDIDLRPSFSAAGPPTFVLVGQRDKATPSKVSKRIAASIESAELVMVENAGHMVIIERPVEVAGHITAWIAQH